MAFLSRKRKPERKDGRGARSAQPASGQSRDKAIDAASPAPRPEFRPGGRPEHANKSRRDYRPGRDSGSKPARSGEPLRGASGGQPALVLKEGRETSVLRRHPWIFSGAIERVDGEPASGDAIAVLAQDGRFLGWAAYSPSSQIRGRLLETDRDSQPGAAWLRRRLEQALGRRKASVPADAGDAMRLVNAEADGLPGLIIDRYADTLVVQILSAGAERWRTMLAETLPAITGCAHVFERSDAEVRALEGLQPRVGTIIGGAPAGPLVITEHGLRYSVDVAAGQKTGFYLDQRESRRRIGELARGREALNAFCYTGGFSLSMLAGGARSVLSIDSSGPALAMARANAELNGLQTAAAQWLEADVFVELRRLRNAGRSFDLIVLDPPKFAPTARLAEAAARGYKDINLNALKLLRPGGLIATFSCSGGISADLFQRIVAGAAADAGVSATIVEHYAAAADHPVLLEFPEGDYLKGLLLRRE